MYCFLLWLSSDFGGVWLFRMHGGKAAFSACPGQVAPYFGSMSRRIYVVGLFSFFCKGFLRTGALFLFLGIPKVPFWTRRMYCFLLWLSSDLGGVWLFRMHGGKAAFSACPGSVAPYFGSVSLGIYVVGLFTCFLRGFQRCRFGPAE